MGLFGQIVKTAVNLTVLPVEMALDAASALPEAGEKPVGHRTRDRLQAIKDDVEDEL